MRCTYRLSVVTVRVTLQLAITKLVIMMTVISNNRFIGLVVLEIECKGTSKVNNLFLCRWKFYQKTVFFRLLPVFSSFCSRVFSPAFIALPISAYLGLSTVAHRLPTATNTGPSPDIVSISIHLSLFVSIPKSRTSSIVYVPHLPFHRAVTYCQPAASRFALPATSRCAYLGLIRPISAYSCYPHGFLRSLCRIVSGSPCL